jgi:hypothetical protein
VRRSLLLALILGCYRDTKKVEKVEEASETKTAMTTNVATTETKTQEPSEREVKESTDRMAVLVDVPDAGTELIFTPPQGAPVIRLPRGSRVIGTVPVASTSRTTEVKTGTMVDTKAANVQVAATAQTDTTKKADVREETHTGVAFIFKLALAGYIYFKFIRKVTP